jgi:LPXTG-motif cell wall-anchored protein
LGNIIRRVIVLGLALLLALALAAPAFAQGGEAQVRVAHLAPDAPNVDVYVNGEPVLTDVAYTTISDYLPLPAGTQQVTVYATGDTSTPVIDTPVEVAAGGAYTIAAVGLVADGSLTAQVYEDDLRAPSAGNAKVRVVHASPDAGPVDVVPRGGDPLVEGLTFPDATPYVEVPEGTYTLDVNPAGTTDTVLTVPDVALADGAVYSAFAVGTVFADSLQVLLVQDNAAGGAAAPAGASASAGASAGASASASATASTSASPSASARPLPDTGGSTSLPLTAAFALMGCGIGALLLVRRRVTQGH